MLEGKIIKTEKNNSGNLLLKIELKKVEQYHTIPHMCSRKVYEEAKKGVFPNHWNEREIETFNSLFPEFEKEQEEIIEYNEFIKFCGLRKVKILFGD